MLGGFERVHESGQAPLHVDFFIFILIQLTTELIRREVDSRSHVTMVFDDSEEFSRYVHVDLNSKNVTFAVMLIPADVYAARDR